MFAVALVWVFGAFTLAEDAISVSRCFVIGSLCSVSSLFASASLRSYGCRLQWSVWCHHCRVDIGPHRHPQCSVDMFERASYGFVVHVAKDQETQPLASPLYLAIPMAICAKESELTQKDRANDVCRNVWMSFVRRRRKTTANTPNEQRKQSDQPETSTFQPKSPSIEPVHDRRISKTHTRDKTCVSPSHIRRNCDVSNQNRAKMNDIATCHTPA